MSRFVRLYPVANLTGAAFKTILTTYLCQHNPKSLIWDNHGQFNNHEVNNVLEDFHISSSSTTPYSHQENSLVERAIGSIRRHLERWSVNHPSEPFSSFIPFAERIQNTQRITGTNNTPNEVVFGTSSHERFETPSSLEQHIQSVNRYQENAVNEHSAALKKRRQESDQLSAIRVGPPDLQPGQRILVRNFKKTKQIDSTSWLGPFTVIRTEGNSVIVADLLHTGTTRPVHVKNIKLLDASFPEPKRPPSDFFEVESVTSHRLTKRGNLVVTIKWVGYEEPSVEHISRNPSLRRTRPLVEYCRSVPELRHFVEDVEVFNDQTAQGNP
jgi:hypothetical protein